MGNVHMEATQINYRGGSKKMSVEEAIKAAGTEITPEEKEWIDTIPELASQEIIAPEFDAEEGVYAVGDLVIYQGGLYQFTTAHETAGAWNAEEVAAVKVSDELSSLKSGLIDVDVALSVPENSGKNVLQLTIDRLKKSNTTGTWAGNVYTVGYNTYTVSVDDNGVVTSIEGTSTNIDSSAIRLDFDLKAGSYILSSGFAELFGANDTFLQKDGVTIARGNNSSPGQNFTLSEDSELTWFFRVTNITKTSYPMIRPATITDPTFAPYIPSVESRIEAVESGLDTVKSGLTDLTARINGVSVVKKASTTGDANVKTFNFKGRGAGLVMVSRNGYDATIGVLTVSSDYIPHFQKLLGADITFDFTDMEAVSITIPSWSNVTILTNASWS